MEIVLVRHGQPAWVGPDDVAVNDPGLTELGRRQARAVAQRLAALEGPTELFSSEARRSRETAEPVAEATGLTPRVEPWIHEIRFPAEWDGTPAQEVGRLLRDSRWRTREQWWEGVEGGESFADFHERVTDGLERLLADYGVTRHPDDPDHLWSVPEDVPRLLLVAHAGTNSIVLGHLLGLDPMPWEWERFASNHASVTILDTTRIATASIWSLQLFSGAAHLGPDELTR